MRAPRRILRGLRFSWDDCPRTLMCLGGCSGDPEAPRNQIWHQRTGTPRPLGVISATNPAQTHRILLLKATRRFIFLTVFSKLGSVNCDIVFIVTKFNIYS